MHCIGNQENNIVYGLWKANSTDCGKPLYFAAVLDLVTQAFLMKDRREIPGILFKSLILFIKSNSWDSDMSKTINISVLFRMTDKGVRPKMLTNLSLFL